VYRIKFEQAQGQGGIATQVQAVSTSKVLKDKENKRWKNFADSTTSEEIAAGITLILCKGLGVPIIDQDNAPPPPPDDGAKNWLESLHVESFVKIPRWEDWLMYFENDTPYYYNLKTQNLTWKKPEGSVFS